MEYVLILNNRWVCVDLHANAVVSYHDAEEMRRQRQDMSNVETLSVYKLVDVDITTDDMHVLLNQDEPHHVEFNTVIAGSILTDAHVELYGDRLKRLEPIGSLF